MKRLNLLQLMPKLILKLWHHNPGSPANLSGKRFANFGEAKRWRLEFEYKIAKLTMETQFHL